VAAGHEEAVALGAAEVEVGATLGQVDVGQRLALGRVDAHAAEQGRIGAERDEGKIQSVQIKGSQIYSADNIRASLPPLQELRKPNTGQIVAAVAAANENPAKQVAVNFQAAEQLGDIDAIVNVTEENPEKILLTADNMGSKSTGVNRYSLGYQHANLFTCRSSDLI